MADQNPVLEDITDLLLYHFELWSCREGGVEGQKGEKERRKEGGGGGMFILGSSKYSVTGGRHL